MTAKLLQVAVTAIKTGQRERGRDLLLELVEMEPRNELVWFWLSSVVDDLEDQIIALENGLAINPNRPKARARLAQLKAKTEAYNPVEALFDKAREAARNGRSREARDLLLDLVQEHPQHERAWWALSRLVDSIEDQIIALENVLQLNPNHTQAQERLTQLQAVHQDHLALGRRYEEQGDLKKAIVAYKFAAKQSLVSADRLIANKRLEAAEAQLKLSKIKTTSPNLTLTRLTIGPPLLFGLLILMQSGLNPLQIAPLSYLGGVGILLGSLLITGAGSVPYHPLWRRTLGSKGLAGKTQLVLIGLGLFLLVLPFVFFGASAIDRLEAFRASLGPTP